MRKGLLFGVLCVLFLLPLFQVQAAPVYYSGTGHYYDFIRGSYTWDAAKTAAEALSYNGAQGYLATLTSYDEDEFIRTNFNTFTTMHLGPWFGANWDGTAYGATDGWHWVTGEAFSYTGWNGGEPNHLDLQGGIENAIHFSGGGWNDIYYTRTDAVGYLVEYNSVPEPATLLLLGLGLFGVAGIKKRLHK